MVEPITTCRTFCHLEGEYKIHIANILKDKELEVGSVIKDYLTTASDGKNYKVKFYSLEMIMAVGFRVRSIRGVQFRQWANQHLRDFLQKGFIINDERLKNPDGRPDYLSSLKLPSSEQRTVKV